MLLKWLIIKLNVYCVLVCCQFIVKVVCIGSREGRLLKIKL
jgi:hypothetical protein